MVFYSIKSSILAKLVKMGLFDLVTPHGFTIKIARLLCFSNLAIFLLIYSHWQTTSKILVHGQNDSASLGHRFIS